MTVVFVHVGKCAGGSILAQFHKNKVSYTELHCGDSPSRLMGFLSDDDGSNHYVVSVRDPVKRFLSSFNFDKYEKIIQGKGVKNPLWSEIYDTFESANHLCESMFCEIDRLRMLSHKAFFNSFLHMSLTLSWYLPVECLVRLPMDRVSVIRTEYVENDLNSFFQHYGQGDVVQLRKDKDSRSFLDEIGIENPLFLSKVSQSTLSLVYDADYRILDYFYRCGAISERYQRPGAT